MMTYGSALDSLKTQDRDGKEAYFFTTLSVMLEGYRAE